MHKYKIHYGRCERTLRAYSTLLAASLLLIGIPLIRSKLFKLLEYHQSCDLIKIMTMIMMMPLVVLIKIMDKFYNSDDKITAMITQTLVGGKLVTIPKIVKLT